jgi:hypothetical protein
MGALRFADHECPFSIWVEQDGCGWWSWELIDREGETSLSGFAQNQGAALQAARRAADGCGEIVDASAPSPSWTSI